MEQTFKLTLRVTWWMQIVQILFGLFFTIGAFTSLLSITRSPASTIFVFLILGSLAYLGWANAFSTIQIDEKSVTVNVFYGRFRINWEEVDLILSNKVDLMLVDC